MKSRKLGLTNISLSEITFGCWQLGGMFRQEWNQDVISCKKLVEKAYELGIRSFDMADAYGNGRAEIIIGDTIAKLNDTIIISKGGQLIGTDGAQQLFLTSGRKTPRIFTKKWMKSACEMSLFRLNREYIDIYLLHDPMFGIEEEAMIAMKELKQEGKIRAWGITAPRQELVKFLNMEKTLLPEVIEIDISFGNDIPNDILSKCKEHKIGIIGRSPFQTGRLFQSQIQSNKPIAQLALEHCLANKDISTIVTGMMKVSEIQENLGYYNSFSKNEYDLLIEQYRYSAMTKSDKKAFNLCASIKNNPSLPNVYMIGDSISISMFDSIRKQLENEINVFRPPLNCKSSVLGLKHIDEWIKVGNVDLCLVNFGIHDTIKSSQTKLEDYIENLKVIFNKLKAWCPKIAWVTTTKQYSGAEVHTDIDLENFKQYADRATELARTMGLEIYSLDQTCDDIDRISDVQEDGCHFLPSGYEKLANTIVAKIRASRKKKCLKIM